MKGSFFFGRKREDPAVGFTEADLEALKKYIEHEKCPWLESTEG